MKKIFYALLICSNALLAQTYTFNGTSDDNTFDSTCGAEHTYASDLHFQLCDYDDDLPWPIWNESNGYLKMSGVGIGNSAGSNKIMTFTRPDEDNFAATSIQVAPETYNPSFTDESTRQTANIIIKGLNDGVITGEYTISSATHLTLYQVDLSAETGFNSIDELEVHSGVQDLRIHQLSLAPPVAPCSDPSIPTITSAPGTICDGNSALLTISGSLNDATQWKVYTGSCGGTLVGSTSGSTLIVTPPTGTTTYYVRGEGGCVTPGICETISITTTAREIASFSYSDTAYFVNDSDPTPTITGVSGTFSSGSGLSINTLTGTIDVSASIPGIYTVTYTTGGVCFNTSDSTITITSNIEYIYENDIWTPQTPIGNSTSNDNITIVDGEVDFNQDVTCNNLTVNVGTLNIFAVLNLNGDLNATSEGGGVFFRSSATQDGELAALSPDSEIQGNIGIERYMSANRAYRMVSSPSNNIIFGQPLTIQDTWQLAEIEETGYATHITGSATGINGFDATITGNPSMFTLDVATQNFVSIPNTDSTPLEPAKAYLLFIRGDRTIDLTNNNSTPTETRLASFGSGLLTGDQAQDFTTTSAGDFVMFGNPYQSAVDMSQVVASSTNVNTSQFYVYDPTLGDNGAYVTVPFTGSPIPAGSDADIYLQPGQGAQIASVSAGNVSVLFQESNKAPGNHTNTFRSLNNLEASISASLYTTENYSAGKKPHDGFALNFSNEYTNATTMDDAPKPFNFFENIGIVSNDGTFSIEQREMPFEGEEISLYSSGYNHNNYTFVLNLENLNGLTTIFRDAYANTEFVLENGENVLNFSVEEDIQASIAEDRFSFNFGESNLGLNQESIFGLGLYPNPVSGEYLTIRSGKLAGKSVNLMVNDMVGRTVMLQEATFSGNELKVNLGEKLTSGTYFMTIENNDRKETLRFIKR